MDLSYQKARDIAPVEIVLDLEKARADLAPLFAEGDMREVMALYAAGPVSLRTNQLETALAFLETEDRRRPKGIYAGLNPLTTPASGPDANRPNGGNVASRDALLLDFDGTDRAALRDARNRAQSFLATQCGFPAYAGRRGTSGNGQYLIYQLEGLTITPEDDALVHRAITALREILRQEFPTVKVDTGVADLVRVRRISGTVNRKYPDAPRLCDLTVHDDQTEPVTRDALQALADMAPATAGDAVASGPRPIGTRELEPAEVEAIAAAVAPYREPGNLHDSYRAIAGWCAHTLLSLATAERILEAVCATDTDLKDRRATLRNTYQRYTEGRPVEWRTTSEDVAPAFRDALLKAQTEIRDRATAAGDEAPSFPTTDTGNAERLVHRHGGQIHYSYQANTWYVWSGTHWQSDVTGRMDQLAKETVRAIPEEAAALTGDAYSRLMKHAAASESAGRRGAMIDLARSEDGVPVTPAMLNADPWKLNTANGTLDLRTGRLAPHDPADLITRCISTPYDADATCPTFLAFLERVFSGDTELIAYVQRMAGYALTGSTREQAVFIAHGNGANGKSTLVSALSALLEDYAQEADTESFLERQGSQIREDLAALDGARFVAASETGDGRRLSEAFVKKVTGGEKIRARRLYENGYEFMPQFKLWLSTNHKPTIIGTDHAIWRRIRLIPFTVTIPEHERDKDLPAKLEAERAGILAWAVEGCRAWLRDGECPPAVVLEATEAYRRDMDALANWIEDRCIVASGERAPAKDLFADYLTYCEASGEDPLKQKTFGTRLTERGFGTERDGRARYRTGIRLKEARLTAAGDVVTHVTNVTRFSESPLRDSSTRDFSNNVSQTSHTSQRDVYEEYPAVVGSERAY